MNIVLLEAAISLALITTVLSRDFGIRVSTTSGIWVEIVALWLVGIIVIWRGAMIIIEQLRGAQKINGNTDHGKVNSEP